MRIPFSLESSFETSGLLEALQPAGAYTGIHWIRISRECAARCRIVRRVALHGSRSCSFFDPVEWSAPASNFRCPFCANLPVICRPPGGHAQDPPTPGLAPAASESTGSDGCRPPSGCWPRERKRSIRFIGRPSAAVRLP